MDINKPKFLLSTEGKVLRLSKSERKGNYVSLATFDGNINQQWFVYGDGDGQVAIMSRHNKSWLGISSRDNKVTVSAIPYWFSTTKYIGGYKLFIPMTDTALSFEDTVEVRSKSAAKQLYILECTPANEAAIKEGQFPWTTEQKNQPAKAVQERSALPPPGNLDGSDHPSVSSNAKAVQERSAVPALSPPGNLDGSDHPSISNNSRTSLVVPNKPRRDVSIFGTSEPKKIIYGHNSQGLVLPTSSPGTADIIGFGHEGVTIWLKDKQANRLVSNHFGYDKGWRNDKHVRLLADTTGRGRADIVGFYDDGVWIAINKGDNTFHEPEKVSSDFSYDKGWRIEKHLRLMADTRNIGLADIVGFGFGCFLVSLNNGDGTFGPVKVAISPFLEGHWILESTPRFLADITGNGLLDIFGFNGQTIVIAFNKGDGNYGPDSVEIHYTDGIHRYNNCFIADLTGNGLPDIIIIKNDGVYAMFNQGGGAFGATVKVIANEFCQARGWHVNRHHCFMADLTGNGCVDILGFFSDGVYVAINNGNGTFQPVKQASKHFGCKSEDWRTNEHRRFVADMTGDGRADIIRIGDNGVYVCYNDGQGNFGPCTFVTSCFSTSQPEWMADKSLVYVANLSV